MVDVPTSAWMALRITLSLDGLGEEAEEHPYVRALFEACLSLSPGGFATEGADAPPGDRPPPPTGHLRVLLYVLEGELAEARIVLEQHMAAFSEASLETEPLSPDWRERWKRWFKAFTVSDRLGVRPPWEAPPQGLRAEALCVEIEPGMAFGTGQHATTHLCLSVLDDLLHHEPLPSSTLDVGCGTGILAITASLRGVPDVLGIDIDEAAVRCARDNALLNNLERSCVFENTPLALVRGRYPLVIANIIAPVLHALADELAAHVAPSGRLLLSGALIPQGDALAEAMCARGLRLLVRKERGEWVALMMERSA